MTANKKLRIGAGLVAVGAVLTGVVGVAGASAGTAPPQGARATVQVSPNPTVTRGQQVTITGNCGGGERLRAVASTLLGDHPMLENVHIVDDNPAGFTATANLSARIGNGVGAIGVDCGTEAGVTLLVTHV